MKNRKITFTEKNRRGLPIFLLFFLCLVNFRPNKINVSVNQRFFFWIFPHKKKDQNSQICIRNFSTVRATSKIIFPNHWQLRKKYESQQNFCPFHNFVNGKIPRVSWFFLPNVELGSFVFIYLFFLNSDHFLISFDGLIFKIFNWITLW